MLIVAGTFEVEADQREQFVAYRREAMRASRAEQGCLEYLFSADPLDARRVVLYERWTSQEALDAHLASSRPSSPSDDPDVQPTSASIVIYDVTGERPLRG